jgi:hypothetical protein
VLRYGVAIGYALRPIAAGSWVHERLLRMPQARSLEGLPKASVRPPPLPPLEGYTFEGYRNPDGSVGTRNLLAITRRCSAWPACRVRGRAHPRRAAAQVPPRGRRGGAGAQLRLRRGHRRADAQVPSAPCATLRSTPISAAR